MVGATAEWLLALKISCMSKGIVVSDEAAALLTEGGSKPMTIHEYATTGGVTLRAGDFFLNAPFDDWYCDRAEALLELRDGVPHVTFGDHSEPFEVLPLPAYVDAVNARGELVTATTMSHCDRIRVSPISGCTLDCAFCDLPALRYTRHSAEEMLASIDVARQDVGLPAHHLLISGGSPGRAHFDWFDETLEAVIAGCGLPTDVMMSPREGSLDFVDRYIDAGAVGFSLNLEVFGAEPAMAIMPRKHLRSTPYFEATANRAMARLGAGTGAVRSIVIVGLDDYSTTLEAVEFIARLGVDPVLSPFRPAQKTKMERWEPPTVDFLERVYAASLEIASRHGVSLGPRCIPCQHNTLVMPTGDEYGYWEHGTVQGWTG